MKFKKIAISLLLLVSIFVITGCSSDDEANVTPTTVPTGIQIEVDVNAEEETSDYTIDEVAEHDSQNDCWMVINNKVYNATTYVLQHPGGKDILQGCGKDATSLFQSQGGDGGHSSQAANELSKLYIGDLIK